jgi:hypothetical protein
MAETRDFHIGDILSITNGKLVSPRHVDGVYDILGWMTGEDLMNHQLPRASRECEDNLRAQHPDLAAIDVPKLSSKDEVFAWLDKATAQYGETRPVAKLDPADHTPIDPLAEIQMMRPGMKVVTMLLPGAE